MKKIAHLIIAISFTASALFLSCKKEHSCEGNINGNKPPIAVAGPDQLIILPSDSVLLDGSASSDPDGSINEFFLVKSIWTWFF